MAQASGVLVCTPGFGVNISVAGLGFAPKTIHFRATGNTAPGTGPKVSYGVAEKGPPIVQAYQFHDYDGAGEYGDSVNGAVADVNNLRVVVASFDADGFTVTEDLLVPANRYVFWWAHN